MWLTDWSSPSKTLLGELSLDDVDDVLLRLYYQYENSPKKLRQLRDLHRIYGESFEFEEGGVRLKCACGNCESILHL